MPNKEIFLTPEGLAKLEAELDYLMAVRRREVAERIQKAKELTDTVNNAEYDDAKNEQAFVEGRILTLEKLIKNATLIHAEATHPDVVKLGSRVTLLTPDGEQVEYVIVGSAEANPSQRRISNESPVGRALLGRRLRDEVAVNTPAGPRKLMVADIK